MNFDLCYLVYFPYQNLILEFIMSKEFWLLRVFI